MNETIVKLLRDMLERAERGDIIAIAVATILPDLSTGSAYKLGDASLCEVVGAVELLKHRVLNHSDTEME